MENRKDYINQDIIKNDFTETFIVVSGLFFLWGFITSMNGILSSKLQVVFQLDAFNLILVQSSFFASYFIFSFVYYISSKTLGDPILKFGFRNTVITGLIIAALGCALFYPAANFNSYNIFLTAMFILAGGITILQIAANSYMVLLGDPRNAASRLILAQALNSLGATLAPFTSLLIFTTTESATSTESVKLPYLGLTAALILFAVLLTSSQFSNIFSDKVKDELRSFAGITSQRHVLFSFLAIFMYVGGEVAIGSFIKDFVELPNIGGILPENSGNYVFYYWGSAMFGRFLGATFLSKMQKNQRQKLIFYFLLIVVCGCFIASIKLSMALLIILVIIIQIICYFIASFHPRKALGVFSIIVSLLLVAGATTYGDFALWSIITIGLFNSIMFPVIFTLGTKELGPQTYQGSSILVMGIVGGAIIPIAQEYLLEEIGLQLSFLLPVLCYAYISVYAFWLSKPKIST